MDKEKKELIEKKESFFKRLFLKIKSLFKKDEPIIEEEEVVESKTIEESGSDSAELTKEEMNEMFEKLSTIEFEEGPGYDSSKDIDSEAEKARIKKLYEDVRTGMISIESLTGIDLILVNKLLASELEITKRKLT